MKILTLFLIFLLIFPIAVAQENLSSKLLEKSSAKTEETFTKEEDSSLVSKIASSLIEKIFDLIKKPP